MKKYITLVLLFMAVAGWSQTAAEPGAAQPQTTPQAAAPAGALTPGQAPQTSPQATAAPGVEFALTEQKMPTQGVFAAPQEVVFSFAYTPDYHIVLDETSLPKDFGFTAKQGESNSPGTYTFTLTALPFTLKEAHFTPLTFLLQNQEGKTVARLQTDEATWNISNAQTFKKKDLKEIRDPRAPWNWLLWVAVFMGLVLVAALIIWLVLRRKNKALHIALPQDNRPCDVIALSKLDALVQSGLWERQAYKTFYLTLTDILREYLLKRFGLDTSADTSLEMLRRLKNSHQELITPLLPQLRQFLSSSDLVKFARAVPPEQSRNRDVQTVREVVQKTLPPKPEVH